MARAKKLPSGNWRVLAGKTVRGKKTYKSFTSVSKKDAELSALEWQNDKSIYDRAPESITLNEAFDEYINSHDSVFSPSTIIGYKKIKNNYFTSMKNMHIADITESDLQIEVNNMAKKLSPKTIRNALGFLCTALSQYGKGINTKLVKMPPQQKIKYATPDIETLSNILNAVKGTDIELPVTLAALLGLRMSEILGLKWDAVSDDTIHIFRVKLYTKGGTILRENTKTYGSNRKLIIPNKIKELLKKADKNQEFVVNLTANQITKRFSRLLNTKGIPHCRFHDLRHANASIMLMLNIPDKYAMERGGWSTDTTLKRVYQQTFASEQEKIAQMLDIFYAQNFETDNTKDNTEF